VPGSGPAQELARVGWAGVQVDGPHGGPRNVTDGDEQFLMFNVTNPPAMRDNVRQSALELALLPDLLATLEIPAGDCPDGETARFSDELALIGHSMGATISPVVLSTEPRYRSAVLSGAGGSWIHNVVHKLSPLETRPLAESILRYDAVGRTLDEFDPILSLLQWVGEAADPPVHAAAMARASTMGDSRAAGGLPDILVFQGVVDTYILPPIANALSVSLALDRAGESVDEVADWPGDYRTYAEARFLGEFAEPPAAVRAAALAQHVEDGIEDGHEVMFQLEAPKHQYRCFLQSVAEGVPSIPVSPTDCD
jgi:pimeloyl-ACP methyl ester carboxylesterase